MSRTIARLLVVFALLLPATTPLAGQTPPKDERQFTVLIFERPADLARRTGRDADAYWSAYDAFAGALAQAGALRGGSALSEDTRETVRGSGSADQGVKQARLGGYFVIAAKDLAEAKRLASSAPAFAVAVEIRPHRANPHMMAPAPK